jgi:DNA-binding CsgD family transcriptional regulator
MDDIRLAGAGAAGTTGSLGARLSHRSRASTPPRLRDPRAGVPASEAERDRVAEALGHALRRAIGIQVEHLHALAGLISELASVDPTIGPTPTDPGDRPGLTAREAEVLRRIVAGRSNKEIGVDLGISERTAEVHVSNVMRKLGVTNRVEAATTGMLLGLGAGLAAVASAHAAETTPGRAFRLMSSETTTGATRHHRRRPT